MSDKKQLQQNNQASQSSSSSSSTKKKLNDFQRLNKLFSNTTLKQVEINTMSAGFGFVSGRVVDLHRYSFSEKRGVKKEI
jgi:hypothetical protein